MASKTRLGMVAVTGRHEGPWILANGAVSFIARVRGLGPSALLWLDLRDGSNASAQQHSTQLKAGDNQIEIQNFSRYRLVKEATVEDAEPTTVEFVYS